MARDLIHYHVRRALEKEGWNIKSDPYRLSVDGVTLEIDLGAEKVVQAEKNGEKIFIEIKTFNQKSILYAFYGAFGQYICYRDGLRDSDINAPLYLAIPLSVFEKIEENLFLSQRIRQHNVKVIVVDTINEIIEKWIK